MKKIFLLVFVFLFLSFWLLKKTPVKCFSLVGKFTVISIKEKIAEKLVFGGYDKTMWTITLSDKRLKEGESFLNCGAKSLAVNKFTEAQKLRDESLNNFTDAQNSGENMTYLKDRLEENLNAIDRFRNRVN